MKVCPPDPAVRSRKAGTGSLCRYTEKRQLKQEWPVRREVFLRTGRLLLYSKVSGQRGPYLQTCCRMGYNKSVSKNDPKTG